MLQGANITLRALEPADLELLYQWENNTTIWRLSNTTTPFSRYQMEQYILGVQDIYSDKQLRLMICLNENDKPIGCIDLFDFDPVNMRAGIGVLIADEQERGKGYASESLDVLIDYAFNILHLHQLYCNVPVDNEASIKLFHKHKFKTVANKKDWINGGQQWIDESLMQLINPEG